ncbi:hypothetical protein SAMN02745116_02634 [Pilibacter termitis]|uniref:Uncharacterized protein n=1 Tax=Pilibacter termitis TaxID=263852 RepID=A0A1T4RLR1_9ENTE|nr:hypothetical protein [Pilibacter termitis]SKA16902.1 hypothetical protein SAMN02745116_02634 [Pilibacter termitis]
MLSKKFMQTAFLFKPSQTQDEEGFVKTIYVEPRTLTLLVSSGKSGLSPVIYGERVEKQKICYAELGTFEEEKHEGWGLSLKDNSTVTHKILAITPYSTHVKLLIEKV